MTFSPRDRTRTEDGEMPLFTSSSDAKAPQSPVSSPKASRSDSLLASAMHSEQQQPAQPSNVSISPAVVPPAAAQITDDAGRSVLLELEDGTIYHGLSFGAEKSIAGELVFQTGMVGYPESITDPSYRGQILVITFPLVGNYGVPSREVMDELAKDLPKYFESSQIHIAGLVVASYCGEEYSHYLAESSLGQWLKEEGVPGVYGIDTRALTKRIREKGSMLGRMLLQRSTSGKDLVKAISEATDGEDTGRWRDLFEDIQWSDPNKQNVVAEGEQF